MQRPPVQPFKTLIILLVIYGCYRGGLGTLDRKGGIKYCHGRASRAGSCFNLRLKIGFRKLNGLFNQHLALLSFITIGIASGSNELLVESSYRRKQSMASSFWVPGSMETLWDAQQLGTFLKGHGIRLVTEDQKGRPTVHSLPEYPSMRDDYADISDAAAAVKRHVLAGISAMPHPMITPEGRAVRTVELALRDTVHSLQTTSSHLYTDVAQHLQFTPHLQSLAQACIDKTKAAGARASYVGIHLRIEDDFHKENRTGGKDYMLDRYFQALQQLRVGPDETLYIASGIFEEGPDFARKYLQTWSSRILYRNMLLPPEDVRTLDVEQLAAIDFLVVSRANKFIGWAGSSFSFWVPEDRALSGLDNATSHIIRGTEAWGPEHDDFLRSNGIFREGRPPLFSKES